MSMTERERFEAWLNGLGPDDRPDYENSWLVWSAASRAADVPEPEAPDDYVSPVRVKLSKLRAATAGRVSEPNKDAARWREFCAILPRLPITYEGEEYNDIASLNAAIDAAIAAHEITTPEPPERVSR